MKIEISSKQAFVVGNQIIDRITKLRSKARDVLIQQLTTKQYLWGLIKAHPLEKAIQIADSRDAGGEWQDWKYLNRWEYNIALRLVEASKLADTIVVSNDEIKVISRYIYECT